MSLVLSESVTTIAENPASCRLPDLFSDPGVNSLLGAGHCIAYEPNMSRFQQENPETKPQLMQLAYTLPDGTRKTIYANVYFKVPPNPDKGYYGYPTGYMSIRVGEISYAFVVETASGFKNGQPKSLAPLEIIRPAYMPTDGPYGDFSDTLAEGLDSAQRDGLVNNLFNSIFNKDGQDPNAGARQRANYEAFQRGQALFNSYNMHKHWGEIHAEYALALIEEKIAEHGIRVSDSTQPDITAQTITQILQIATDSSSLYDFTSRKTIAWEIAKLTSSEDESEDDTEDGPVDDSENSSAGLLAQVISQILHSEIVGLLEEQKIELVRDVLLNLSSRSTKAVITGLLNDDLSTTNPNVQLILINASWGISYRKNDVWRLVVDNFPKLLTLDSTLENKQAFTTLLNSLLMQLRLSLQTATQPSLPIGHTGEIKQIAELIRGIANNTPGLVEFASINCSAELMNLYTLASKIQVNTGANNNTITTELSQGLIRGDLRQQLQTDLTVLLGDSLADDD